MAFIYTKELQSYSNIIELNDGFSIGSSPQCQIRIEGSKTPSMVGRIRTNDVDWWLEVTAESLAWVDGQTGTHLPLIDGSEFYISGCVDRFQFALQDPRHAHHSGQVSNSRAGKRNRHPSAHDIPATAVAPRGQGRKHGPRTSRSAALHPGQHSRFDPSNSGHGSTGNAHHMPLDQHERSIDHRGQRQAHSLPKAEIHPISNPQHAVDLSQTPTLGFNPTQKGLEDAQTQGFIHPHVAPMTAKSSQFGQPLPSTTDNATPSTFSKTPAEAYRPAQARQAALDSAATRMPPTSEGQGPMPSMHDPASAHSVKQPPHGAVSASWAHSGAFEDGRSGPNMQAGAPLLVMLMSLGALVGGFLGAFMAMTQFAPQKRAITESSTSALTLETAHLRLETERPTHDEPVIVEMRYPAPRALGMPVDAQILRLLEIPGEAADLPFDTPISFSLKSTAFMPWHVTQSLSAGDEGPLVVKLTPRVESEAIAHAPRSQKTKKTKPSKRKSAKQKASKNKTQSTSSARREASAAIPIERPPQPRAQTFNTHATVPGRITGTEIGMGLRIDGQNYGTTPYDGPLPLGEHQFQLYSAKLQSWLVFPLTITETDLYQIKVDVNRMQVRANNMRLKMETH